MIEYSSQRVEQAIKEELNSFNPAEEVESSALTRHITIWVTEETKALYDEVQAYCKHRFTKNLRNVMSISIKDAHSKIVR